MVSKVLSLFALPAAAALTHTEWMALNNVSYDCEVEQAKREEIFNQNAAIVEQLMADAQDTAVYHLGGHFADLSQAEFAEQYLMGTVNAKAMPTANKHVASVKDIPASFDWREKGAVTSVKDQGSLGTCWIFSTIGNLEGQRFLAGEELVDLSVEHVLECDNTIDTSGATKNADCGMFGGWPYLAMEGIIARGGVFSDADMPYCSAVGYGKDGSCMPCMADDYDQELCGNYSDDDGGIPLYCEPESTLGQGPEALCKNGETDKYKFAMSISNWTDASSGDSDAIAASLVELGPLSVAMDATKLQFYKEGVFNPSKCSTTALNHALLMVGYGTDDTDGDYFIIKNSWAEKWGEDGYFRIAKADDAGVCGINTAVVSGLV